MLSRRTLTWSWGTTAVSMVVFTIIAVQFAPHLVLPSMAAGIILGMIVGAIISSKHASLMKWPDSWF